MGKYPKSEFLNSYSDWHWQRCERWACLSDIDRIFIEVRKMKPIIATDIKREEDKVTPTEEALYNWLEAKGLPVFIVQSNFDFQHFKVTRFKTGEVRNWTNWEYMDWLNKLGNE